MKAQVLVLATVVALAVTGNTRASDPVGVYARIDKVVLEPNGDRPERIQIWGTFALAKKASRDEYEQPIQGYLYYSLDKNKEDVCRKEWADLKSVAGKDQCIAFGSRYKPKSTVRKADDKPKDPETYPIGIGVVKVEASSPHAKALKARAVQ
jgi:hypothetical protein